MTMPVKSPKKLIEVALPLDAINEAAAREKSIRHGNPSTLHLWWARRPLAAARAIIFAQMVNDPSWKWELEHPGEYPPNHLKASWAKSRKRLFDIIKDLVKWENTTSEVVLEKARVEIRKSWFETCELNKDHPQAAELFDPEKLPAFHDPFAGGGALPLEAQRLGLEAYASDLNPVAVLINKAMIEIPPKFAGCPPVNPEAHSSGDLVGRQWKGAQGLAEDVRYYGQWMREEAQRRIGHLYQPVEITAKMAEVRPDLRLLIGQRLTIIAWIWARTVKSPNPAFANARTPLTATFMLSERKGKEAFVELSVEGESCEFIVRTGKPADIQATKSGTKLSRGAFKCVYSGTPFPYTYIDDEANAGRLGRQLMAIVAEGPSGKVYLSPAAVETFDEVSAPSWVPETPSRGTWASNAQGRKYGFKTFGDYFIPRQQVAMTTLADLVGEAIERVSTDAQRTLGKEVSQAYSSAVGTYLAFALSNLADRNSSLCGWVSARDHARNTFARQGVAMVWEFAEANPFCDSSGNFYGGIEKIVGGMAGLPASRNGSAFQSDAVTAVHIGRVISTDPPYYDNIGYADLSDFFYVWLRRSLRHQYPELFATIAVPKQEELVAEKYRHGSQEAANHFFLTGMKEVMAALARASHPAFPMTIYYALKQAETEKAGDTSSSGWETFLEAVIASGLSIVGTWPVRTEREARTVGIGSNALASSIVLVCQPIKSTAQTISRREFVKELNRVLPVALDEMTRGAGDERSPVAPVDLSQAIIGPGIAIFSRYAAVLEADGTKMNVQSALRLINRFLAEDDFDHDTQFCLHWFEQFGWSEGKFGDADTLARAKGTAVEGVESAGVLFASGGVVRLLRWSEYPADWDVTKDERLPIWEALHHLIRVFKAEGESGAGQVLAAFAAKAEPTRQLAYRLYTLCERAGRAEDARAYNEIVTSWSAIESAAAAVPKPQQANLFE